MKIINKKILILFSAILLLSIAAFSTITLLFADEENGIEENSTEVAAATYQSGMSIIDYIIENSYNTENSNDQTYHVVELYSGSTPSALQDMVEGANKVFEQHVFNDNKTALQTKDLNPGKIDYQGFSLADTADATTAAQIKVAINNADFLYVSDDPANPWSATNDILNDEVREAINNYISDERPIVFDSHSLTMQDVVNGDKKVKDIAGQFWAVEGTSWATYKWPHDMAVNTFMDPAEQSATYQPIDGDQHKNTVWVPVTWEETNPDPHTAGNATITKTDYVAKILVFHNSAVATGDTHLTDKIKANFSGNYDFTGKTITTAGFDTTKETLILDEDSDFYKFGYYGRHMRPTAIQFEYLDMSDTDQFKQIAHVDYSQYDFVLVEPSTKEVEVGSTKDTADDVYTSLITAMKSGKDNVGTRVLYDDSLIEYVGGGNSDAVLEAVNIAYLYNKVASSTGVPKYEYVLISSRSRMSIYAQATTGRGVKDIANIINAGTFRGISGGGTDDSSNVYTVLEIEPCYPIDTTLATYLNPVKNMTYKGGVNGTTDINFLTGSDTGQLYQKIFKDSYYYIRTDGVLSDTTDEIDYSYNGKSLTSLLESPTDLQAAITQNNIQNVKDYYKWRLSKAKIAHATGRSYDQISVVHMSSTEFDCSRKTLLDNYDAIYIGGDHSAIKDIDRWYTKSKNLNCYNMYYHNGDIYSYLDTYNDKKTNCDYGVFSGNDITKNKLDELKNYASKGMPVILDKDVCDAYVAAYPDKTNQTLFDPESNMFKFFSYVTTVNSGTLTSNFGHVVVNFDSTSTYKAKNDVGQYGTRTVEPFATVFLGEQDPTDSYVAGVRGRTDVVGERQFAEALNAASRPLLAVTAKPKTYIDNDETTWIDIDSIKDDGMKWSVSVSTPRTKINLYIDDDSDGKFEENAEEHELVDKQNANQPNKPVTLTFKPQPDYYGVIYWKVEAISDNGLSSSTTGCCKIKRTNQSKMYVNLLQIMPSAGEGLTKDSSSSNTSLRTLFLCTECQFAKGRLDGNRYTPTGVYYAGLMGGENTFYCSDVAYISSENSIVSKLSAFSHPDVTYTYKGKNNGSHTHDFGIVKYDSLMQLGGTDANHTGVDDIETNWFDDIRKDYDVDTTILYTSEFDAKVDEVKALYSSCTTAQDVENKKIGGMNGYANLYSQYLNYYNGIKAVINGYVEGYTNSYHTVSGTSVTVDWTAINDDFSTGGVAFTTAMTSAHISLSDLEKYANASYKMDDLLKNHLDQFNPDKDTKASGYFAKIVRSATNSEINRDMRKYYDVLNSCNDSNAIGNHKLPQEFCDQYALWRDANILKNFFFEMSQDYLWYNSYDFSTGTVDLDSVYTCIAIGAAEHFGGKQSDSDLSENSCKALNDYIDKQGNLILFHDTLNASSDSTSKMTKYLSTKFGQNARHQDESVFGGDTYYLSSFGGSIGISPRMLSYRGRYGDMDPGHISDTNYEYNFMYKYGYIYNKFEELSNNNTRIGAANNHMRVLIKNASNVNTLPTDHAKRNNEGIITMYPFGIRKDLQIGCTSPQGYAVDVESEDVVVYYSLVGGSQGTNSSFFAADPMDGINNYFLYQNGSITYTGAGHGLLTGFGRENNDERKLFINCIVNAGKKSARGASLNLYDLDSTEAQVAAGKANKKIVPFSGEDANYYTEIENMSDFSGFDFLASIPTSSQLKHVKIFYDVNHEDHINNDNGVFSYDSADGDKLIFDSDRVVSLDSGGDIIEDESVEGNMLKSIKPGITDMLLRPDGVTPMIALNDDCFDAGTGKQYAYIVVIVDTGTASSTQTTTAVLRIQYKAALNDLN